MRTFKTLTMALFTFRGFWCFNYGDMSPKAYCFSGIPKREWLDVRSSWSPTSHVCAKTVEL